MPLSLILFSIIAAAHITLRILSQTELWQRKEYRWDRLWSLLRSSERRTVVSYWWLLAIISQLLAGVALAYSQLEMSQYLATITLASLLTQQIMQIGTRGVYRPHLTTKGLSVLGLSTGVTILSNVVFLSISRLPWLLGLSTLALLVPIIVGLSVMIVNIPFAQRKQQIINRAMTLRRSLPHLQTVGITGSFGKTSTKFFLEQLLAEQPEVIVSAQHRNSALVIAQDMLARLTPTTKLYVAEMGAYTKGEIADLARIVQPQIGIITAIGNQHLALFGSKAAILAAKWELIEALPPTGTAILNYDDEQLRSQAQKAPCPIMWYSTKSQTDVWIENVVILPESITGQLHIKDFIQSVTIPLLSEAMLSSTLAAVTAASAIGMSSEEIVEKLQNLTPYARTMELRHNTQNVTIIDDSYSGNEQGVAAAVQHLQRFTTSRKVIVLTPLIELGMAGPAVHERLGRLLAMSGADIVLTNSTYQTEIQRGGQTVTAAFSPLVLETPKKLLQYLQSQMQPDMVILLEGRLPEVVRQAVLQ